MDFDQILATGGASGITVAVIAAVYMLCKSRRSRCQSNCSTDADSADSPRPPISVKVSPMPAP